MTNLEKLSFVVQVTFKVIWKHRLFHPYYFDVAAFNDVVGHSIQVQYTLFSSMKIFYYGWICWISYIHSSIKVDCV